MENPTYKEPRKVNTERKMGYNNWNRSQESNNSDTKPEQTTGELQFQVYGKNLITQ